MRIIPVLIFYFSINIIFYSQSNYRNERFPLFYGLPSESAYSNINDKPDFIAIKRVNSQSKFLHGENTFRIISSENNNDRNNEQRIIVFLIQSFFQNLWFLIILVVIIGSLFFIILRKLYKTKKDLEIKTKFVRQLIESQESEKKKLAAQLHDSTGQNLLVIKNFALLSLKNRDIPESIKEKVNSISQTASTVLSEIRNISHNLRPYDIDRFGFTEAVKSAIEKVTESIEIKMESRIENIDSIFTKETELNLYRIIQESLNNIIKYSKATECTVEIVTDDHFVIVSIKDNGAGFDIKKLTGSEGSGIRAMDERVKLVNGKFGIESAPGQGTKIKISIPLKQKIHDGSQEKQKPERQVKEIQKEKKPAEKTEKETANNLPEQKTNFIGREKEIFEIRKLISQYHIVTLLGPGGIGKTSLSLQAGADILDNYQNGVWVIELASIKDGSLITQLIAKVFGLREAPNKKIREVLTEYLKEKELLIILDNCEHLKKECSEIINLLLQNCPKLKILATSREPLGLDLEQIYRIAPLSYPEKKKKYKSRLLLNYESVKLFIERASTVRQGFDITDTNAVSIAHICNKLEGIPLAIELTAARVGMLPIETISERLNERFNLLTRGKTEALPRQQTLRAAIDWSYELLEKKEQILLNRLSVFSGGWKLEAAEEVCQGNGIEKSNILDLLDSLVSKSLVVFDEDTYRYNMLETIREYSAEKLTETGEEEEYKYNHLKHFSKLAEEAEPHFIGTEAVKWHKILDEEIFNIRLTLSFCLQNKIYTEQGLCIAMNISRYLERNGNYTEAQEWLNELLNNYNMKNVISANVLVSICQFEYLLGNCEKSISAGEQALNEFRLLNDKKGISKALLKLAIISSYGLNDFKKGESLYYEALKIKRELGDKRGIANTLCGIASITDYRGDYNKSEELLKEALAIKQELGDKRGIANILYSTALISNDKGYYDKAISKFEDALKIYYELGEKQRIATTLGALGQLLYEKEDNINAIKHYEKALVILRELNDKLNTARIICFLGEACRDNGDYVLSNDHLEDALGIFNSIGNNSGIASAKQVLGKLKYKTDDFKGALSNLKDALKIFLELDTKYEIEDVLRDIAEIVYAQNYSELSAVLLGAAENLRERMNKLIPPNYSKSYNKLVSSLKASLDEEEFAKKWAEGRALSMEEAIQLALNENK